MIAISERQVHIYIGDTNLDYLKQLYHAFGTCPSCLLRGRLYCFLTFLNVFVAMHVTAHDMHALIKHIHSNAALFSQTYTSCIEYH